MLCVVALLSLVVALGLYRSCLRGVPLVILVASLRLDDVLLRPHGLQEQIRRNGLLAWPGIAHVRDELGLVLADFVLCDPP